jgi:hypothetical protein
LVSYLIAFFAAGLLLPLLLHIVSPEKMPWWPDTVSMGAAFGVTALVIVWKQARDREAQRRVWNSLKEIGEAIGRRWTNP